MFELASSEDKRSIAEEIFRCKNYLLTQTHGMSWVTVLSRRRPSRLLKVVLARENGFLIVPGSIAVILTKTLSSNILTTLNLYVTQTPLRTRIINGQITYLSQVLNWPTIEAFFQYTQFQQMHTFHRHLGGSDIHDSHFQGLLSLTA